MIIRLTRTGGFTGIPLKKTIDTSKLPKAQAEKIEQLVGQANFTNSEQSSQISQKPDQFTYEISIQDQAISQSFKFSESYLSGQMQELVDYLKNVSLQ